MGNPDFKEDYGVGSGRPPKLSFLYKEVCGLPEQGPAFPAVLAGEGGKGRGVPATILPTPVPAEAGGRRDPRVGRPRCAIQPPPDLRVPSEKPCPEPRASPRPWASLVRPGEPLAASLRARGSRAPRGGSRSCASWTRGAGLGGRGAEARGTRGHAAALAPRGAGAGSHRTGVPRPRGSGPGLWDPGQSLGLIVIG